MEPDQKAYVSLIANLASGTVDEDNILDALAASAATSLIANIQARAPRNIHLQADAHDVLHGMIGVLFGEMLPDRRPAFDNQTVKVEVFCRLFSATTWRKEKGRRMSVTAEDFAHLMTAAVGAGLVDKADDWEQITQAAAAD